MEREAPSFFESVCLLTFLKGFLSDLVSKTLPKLAPSCSEVKPKCVRLSFLKSWKNRPPSLQNQSQKPSKIHPKTVENPSQNAPKSRSGRNCASDRFGPLFFAAFWGVLGRLACLLEPSWSGLGVSGGVFGVPCRVLGAVLRRMLRVLEASWRVLGTSWGVLGHLEGVSRAIPQKTCKIQ